MQDIRHRSIYEAIGGYSEIEKIVDSFYERVAKHPLLIPIFPEDLTETARKQKLFLTQFFGGPRLYEAERGHPMMRRRHLPFPITPSRRDAWLDCMEEALEEARIDEPYRTVIFEKLTLTANHMMNTPE
ncbi:globin domain-containing protein [Oceanobacillus alkalisoli]|uniref:globin domain-containing protein n=1 Tax=Oceanobacillus alkalisoli TaxID=2925113 RepID=UPI001EE4BED0|nr:globin [Oceanobacillus alkalisoli]MCG5105056.1 globin [Oceanobacillus alkalisoli]